MSADTMHTEVLEITGLGDKTKKFGTLEITVYTHTDGATESTWTWIAGPDGFDSGVFKWKSKLLELYSKSTNSFAWAVTNWSWKLDGVPLPRVPPWFSEKDTIHVVNEDVAPYREFDAKPRK